MLTNEMGLVTPEQQSSFVQALEKLDMVLKQRRSPGLCKERAKDCTGVLSSIIDTVAPPPAASDMAEAPTGA